MSKQRVSQIFMFFSQICQDKVKHDADDDDYPATQNIKIENKLPDAPEVYFNDNNSHSMI